MIRKLKNTSKKQHVGIYAGTFDPVHEGHLAFAREAIAQCGIKKVYFLPEPRPRRKQGVRALIHRESMVRAAVQSDSKLGVIQLDHGNFTVQETLPRLRALFEGAELYFLMGEDVFLHLTSWPHVSDLLSSSTFIVGIRKNDQKQIRSTLRELQKTRGSKFQVLFIESSEQNLSSSQIRLALKGGESPQGLLKTTEQYIKEHKLYATEE